MLLNRFVLSTTSRLVIVQHSFLKQILRFDHWEYFVSWVRAMLDILDEANAPGDTDNATELLSTARTSTIHTKLGSPKPAATLKDFMQVLTGPGNPLPYTFQGKLETFLNTSDAANQASRGKYLKLQKEDKVTKSIVIVYRLLMRV